MYTSFGVKNFRCFRDLQLNDLGRVNLIAGRNNSGKTALLEAIYLHSGDRNPKTFLRDQGYISRTPRDYRRLRESDDVDSISIISWDAIFNNFDTTKSIEMSAKFSRPKFPLFDKGLPASLEISIKPQDSEDFDKALRQFRISNFNFYNFDFYEDMEMLEIKPDYRRQPDYMLLLNGGALPSRFKGKPLIQSDFLHAREKIALSINAERFSNMRQARTVSTLIDALQIIEPRLIDLEIPVDSRRPLIYADIGLGKLIPLSSLGDGMNRLASLILAMGETAQGVIFIDEIENGLHYTIQKDVWKIIGQIARNLNIQVFATTHSLEMIRAAHEAFKGENPYDFRYHRLDRNADTGDIEAVTYNEFSMNAVVSIDYEVRG